MVSLQGSGPIVFGGDTPWRPTHAWPPLVSAATSFASTYLVASPSFSLGLARRRFPLHARTMQGTSDSTWGPFSVASSAVGFLLSAFRCHLHCRPLSRMHTVGVALLAAIPSLLRCAFLSPQDLFSSIAAASPYYWSSAPPVPLLAIPLSLVPLPLLQSTPFSCCSTGPSPGIPMSMRH